MNPSVIPLIVVALLMMIGDGSDVDRATLLLGGANAVDSVEEAIVVAGGETRLTSAETADVYVVGGRLEIDPDSQIDVLTQLGGSVVIEAGATITELRAYGGELDVRSGARIGRRVSLDTGEGSASNGASSAVAVVVAALGIASLGVALERRRPQQLANVAHAATRHPVVSLAVGLTVGLTGIALAVFMAFTLVLIPISLVAIAIGVGLLVLGIVGLGHRIGVRLRWTQRWAATGVGVVVTILALWLIGMIPLIGDIVVLLVLTAGLGAGVVSLLGFRRFEPPSLPS